jgi:hypothetical protein
MHGQTCFEHTSSKKYTLCSFCSVTSNTKGLTKKNCTIYKTLCFSLPYNHFLLQWNWYLACFNQDTHTQTYLSLHIVMNIKIVQHKWKLKWLNKFKRNPSRALNISAQCTALHTYKDSNSLFNSTKNTGATQWHSWLRQCATSQKIVRSIPDGVFWDFSLT